MQETRWWPDTCGCVIVYEWDRDLPPSERTHTIKRVETKCEYHLSLVDNELWSYVVDENLTKNEAIATLKDQFGGSYDELIDLYQLSWYWVGTGKDRVLHLVCPTLDAVEKAQLQVFIDNILGSGKVVVE